MQLNNAFTHTICSEAISTQHLTWRVVFVDLTLVCDWKPREIYRCHRRRRRRRRKTVKNSFKNVVVSIETAGKRSSTERPLNTRCTVSNRRLLTVGFWIFNSKSNFRPGQLREYIFVSFPAFFFLLFGQTRINHLHCGDVAAARGFRVE